MPSALRKRPAPRRPRRPRAASGSRSGVVNGPCRPGCRGSRRSRSVAGRCGDAGRRRLAAPPADAGRRARARRDPRWTGGHPVQPARRPAGRERWLPTPATPGLGVAGMDEHLADPGFEAVRVPQRRELAPDRVRHRLHGVLGQVGVARFRTASAYDRSLIKPTSAPNASRSPSLARSTSSRTPTPSVSAPTGDAVTTDE